MIGSWYGSLYASAGYGSTLPYELPSSLRSVYTPYMSGRGTTSYMDPGYARYNDLLTWSNAMRYDQNLRESDRMARWRRRLEFEQLDDLERRTRWNKMSYADRSMLGLAGGYVSSTMTRKLHGADKPYSGTRDLACPTTTIQLPFDLCSTLSRAPWLGSSSLTKASLSFRRRCDEEKTLLWPWQT